MHKLRQLSNDRFEFSNEGNSHVGQHEGALVDVGDGTALNRVTAEGSNSVTDARVPDWKAEPLAAACVAGPRRESGENRWHRDIRVLFWLERERAIDGRWAMSLQPSGGIERVEAHCLHRGVSSLDFLGKGLTQFDLCVLLID